MGKKLYVGKYTFDASANSITVNNNIAAERLLIVTDVTNNKILYNFADTTLGFSNRTYDSTNKKTTFVLDADCVALGCADADSLQIFIEEEAQEVVFSDAYLDPVSKIRVSNPENLIDTDFEYGLQSTKWETLELTNNIPTFFNRDGDFDIELSSMQVNSGSDIVTVTTTIAHSLQRGSPIIIQSSGNVAADGGFIVAGVVSDTVFNFKAKNIFTITDDIKETYTQLFSAKIYTGTEFKLNQIGGITTDAADPSTITVNTINPTNFTNGTSMAMSNTFAKSTVELETDNVIVDNIQDIDISYTSATPTGEDASQFNIGGVSSINFTPEDTTFYFEEGDYTVDTANDTITFNTPHGLTNHPTVSSYVNAWMYLTDETTNTPIGGMFANRTYWIYVIDEYTVSIHYYFSTSNGVNYKVNLTGPGVSGGINRSCFTRALWVYYTDGRYVYSDRLNTTWLKGNNVNTEFGAPGVRNRGLFSQFPNSNATWQTGPYGGNRIDLIHNGNSSTYDYWYTTYTTSQSYRARRYFEGVGGSYYASYYNRDVDAGWTNIKEESKRSSLWVPNHGIAQEGQLVTVSATTGTLPGGLVSGTTYKAVIVNSNRLAFDTVTGTAINFTTGGSTDLVYRIQSTNLRTNANTIDIPGNTLADGDLLTYDINGGTAIGGLTDATTYYVAFRSGNKFMLSTTANVYGVSDFLTNQASSAEVDLVNNTVNLGASTFTNGDAVVYTSGSPIIGLIAGAIYWVREVTTNNYGFYNSQSDANANINRVNLAAYGSGGGTITKVNVIDFTSIPVTNETHKFSADFIGAADGLYEVATTASNGLSFTFDAGNQIEARTKTAIAQQSVVADFDALRITNHGFITGDSVTLTLAGTTNITGLSNGTYYTIRVNKDFLRLATSESNAISNTYVTITETGTSATALTGTISLQPTTIVGSFNGTGTISFDAESNYVTGTSTAFTSYFSKGDTFFINRPETTTSTEITVVNTTTDVYTATAHTLVDGDLVTLSGTAAPTGLNYTDLYYAKAVTVDTFSLHYTRADAIAGSNIIQLTDIGTSTSVNRVQDAGSIIEREIDYVNGDTKIQFTTALPSTAQTDVNYLQNTSLLIRPDGFALHRPYDGGVELIPSTNPDSTMIRQTRKYFRYQSGKGIQVSFAVNFSPTSQMDTFTRSGTVGTITTRFPHRLSEGLEIVTSGSTNADDTLGTINLDVTVAPDQNGQNKFQIDGEEISTYTFYEGRTYRLNQSDSSNSGHPLRFSTTEDGTHGGGVEYTTGVTTNGTPGNAGAYTEIVLGTGVPDLYTYCSVHSGMGFAVTTPVDPANNRGNLWNGTLTVQSIVDDFTFTVALDGTPSDSSATGIVEYYVKNWENSLLRCGLYDDQNGIFFEYDGADLKVCRRSSVKQLSGYANLTFRDSLVTGINSKFLSQLSVGETVVIKGQSYKISRIDSDTQMYIIPGYRGITLEKAVLTKTEDTKVRQENWNLDVCDGTGYTGFILDVNKIQMAYVDYSWYGAGKVRFGFKDQHGNVKYVHEFIHGNEKTEAYMRSGNVPARYEIQNVGTPTYVPALAHWGTSVIMDGTFDPDKAYIFNANSKNLTLTGASQLTTSAKVDYTGVYYTIVGRYFRTIGYAIELDNADSTLNQVTAGTVVTGADLQANTSAANPSSGSVSPYQPYLPSITSRQGFSSSTEATRNLLVINKPPLSTNTSSTYAIGEAIATGVNVTKDIPLISIRLAPSVDTSAPGFLGEREIINRMQLILTTVNVLSTHAASVQLILNGQLSSNAWERVTPPSLSQLLLHENEDTIQGGLSVFNFEAQGGTGTAARTPVLTTEALGDIATLGNSILGGDNVFPDGPDVLTLVATLSEDPSTVSSSNPFTVSGRIGWTESQA